MKKMLFIAVAGLIAMAGCKTQETRIQCDVEPDEVFGTHYTAADFSIFYADDFGCGRYALVMREVMDQLPDSLHRQWSTADGLMLAASDTAAYNQALLVTFWIPTSEGGNLRRLWQPVQRDDDTLYRLLCFYGDEEDRPILDGSHIDSAWVEEWDGHQDLTWQFDREGTKKFGEITTKNIGQLLVFMLGDSLLSAPTINAGVTEGRCSLGGLDLEKACALARILNER
ncbi:MAG: hypothetical protein K6F85_00295 [Bacteroidales bacterium]|nr:hypothetical protein [Bacteroidales bacterium]